MKFQIFNLGENAVTVDFGREISTSLNDKVLDLDKFINANKFAGFIESVPAYSSLTVFFELKIVRTVYPNFPTVFDFVRDFLENAAHNCPEINRIERRIVEIPVCYDLKFAPDLEFVADYANLTVEEVIRIHAERIYRVFMLGFLPGFAYLGELDERIAAPRKQTPRARIAKGSVGIAGRQTGIYPFDSPGGWQIIGQTSATLFQPEKNPPTLLQTGDLVKFVGD
jgi:inhibitor of KinA